jgi:hypothetical protein
MLWLIALLIAVVIVVLFIVFRRRISSQEQTAATATSTQRDPHAGMPDAQRRFLATFLISLGLAMVYMEISLLSLDFPDTPPVSELDFRGAFPNDERQPGAQPPAPNADGTAGAAANPVVQNSPTSVSYPVIQYVLPQSTIGSTPSAWLTVYGENLTPDSQVRLNGQPAAIRALSTNLLAVQLPASVLVSKGSVMVDVVQGGRISNAVIVPVTNPKVPLNVFFLHTIFEWKPWINREVQLLLVVIFAGALGSYIHLLRSATAFMGNGTLKASWFWFYLTGPFVGMAMALIFYGVLRGGFLAGTAADEKVVNQFGVLAVGALVGMFTDKAGLKLKEVFETVFRSSDARTGKLDAPLVSNLSPNKISAGRATDLVVTILGERLRKVTTVRFNSTEKPVEVLSDTKITFKLEPAEMANPTLLKVTVVDPEAGTSVSAPLPIVPPPAVSEPEALPPAQVNAAYTAEIKATEGVEPYKWSLAAGSPAWASIDEKTGTLTGTPDAAGDVAITVKVEDASEVSAEKAYTLSVT